MLLNPNNGGRKLFGYSDADLTTGMIQMSRMGLNSRAVDRLQIICNQNKRLSTSAGARHSAPGDGAQRGGTGGVSGSSGAAGGGEDRHGLTSGQGVQTAPGGAGIGSGPAKHGRNSPGWLAITDDGEGGQGTEEARIERQDSRIMDDDHSQTLKIKAAQALFRMSLEPGGEASGLCESIGWLDRKHLSRCACTSMYSAPTVAAVCGWTNCCWFGRWAKSSPHWLRKRVFFFLDIGDSSTC